MKLELSIRAVICAVTAATLPGFSQAAIPGAMLEKSQLYAHDNVVRAFAVPTKDSTGKISYYDLTIELTVKNNGTIDPLADVSATVSPSIQTRVVAPGTYTASDGKTCKVTNMTLTNGRIQSFFECSGFELSVATGKISNGHPYLAFLKERKLDQLSDSQTYTWGRVTNGRFDLSDCGTFSTNYAVGAKTNGNKLNLTIFGSSTDQRCQATLTKK